MAVVVKGYGTFDPKLPDWLELRADGKLHNKNAADPNLPWDRPADWRGGDGIVFTPESAPDARAVAVREFTAAVKALGEYHGAILDAYIAEAQRQLDAAKALVDVLKPVLDKFSAALKVAVGG